MKRKNLERTIILSLLFGSIAMPVWAESNQDNTSSGYLPLQDNGSWEGKMNRNGEGVAITESKIFASINVQATGVSENYDNKSDLGDTTTALLIDGKADVTVNGSVIIKNSARNEIAGQEIIDNNNALFVKSGTITINGGDEQVFIYAVDGYEKRSAAISVRENSLADISGNNVQIIGNIDFLNQSGHTYNTANITLNTSKSYWYGNEGQAADIEQLDALIDYVAESASSASFGIMQKEECREFIEPEVKDILKKFGGGNLSLTLNDGAEWVYDSNGKTEIQFTDGQLIAYIPDDELDKLIKAKLESLGHESWGNYITPEKVKNMMKSELDDLIDVTVQSEPSKITSITLNGGVVNLQDDDIKQKYANYIVADGEEYIEHQKVTIENLSGTGGIFKADLDWAANNGQKNETVGSDYIYIEKMDESADGKSTQTIDFNVSKAHLEQMKINEDKLYFANVKEGTTDFVTVNGTKQAVYSGSGNVFNYQYGVGSETETNSAATDWYIGLTGKSAEGNANVEAAKGAMYAGYALGTELDTLNKRMGEARYLEDDNGVWVRYRHAKTGWDNTFETNSDMFQLGFDNEVQEDDGKHYRGVAIDYTDADTSLNGISGDGEYERYAVSLYDTWLGEKGHYRDLVIRGGRINSDYDLNGMFTDGMHDIGGDYHQWFGSISAEWGRKNDMSKGWYFEPQTQLQLARVGGASYVSDSGVEVDQDGATSLIGRVGFRLGREYVKDNGKADNYYFKADLLHEFMGDKAIALTGADGRYENEYDGDETWFDIGLGADISIGKNSYFWADVERTIGADFDNTWQVNGGFRWEF